LHIQHTLHQVARERHRRSVDTETEHDGGGD
jgi:hypothetical protein